MTVDCVRLSATCLLSFSAVLASFASPSWAQCTSTKESSDYTIRGNPKYQGSTTQASCTGRTVQVGTWMDGAPSELGCSDDNCTDTNALGNAVQQIWAVTYGTWTAHSTHRYHDGGDWTDLGELSRTLNAGLSPEEECEAANGTWSDGFCEVSPPESPIVISVARNAKYRFTSAEQGVRFDINGDGRLEQVGWTEAASDVGFLALDRDGDGKITSGRELLGSATLPGVTNGFEALRRLAMESNGGIERGSVSSDDPIFGQLLLWFDTNHNGVSETAELRPVTEYVSDIGLGYKVMPRRDGNGNLLRLRGWVQVRTEMGRNRVKNAEENNERTRMIWDVFLMVK